MGILSNFSRYLEVLGMFRTVYVFLHILARFHMHLSEGVSARYAHSWNWKIVLLPPWSEKCMNQHTCFSTKEVVINSTGNRYTLLSINLGFWHILTIMGQQYVNDFNTIALLFWGVCLLIQRYTSILLGCITGTQNVSQTNSCDLSQTGGVSRWQRAAMNAFERRTAGYGRIRPDTAGYGRIRPAWRWVSLGFTVISWGIPYILPYI